MRRATLIVGALLCGCGGQPLLSHLPQPNPALVAGMAAAAAGAATLANPAAAGRKPEEDRVVERAASPSVMMPPEMLDKLDQAQRDAGP